MSTFETIALLISSIILGTVIINSITEIVTHRQNKKLYTTRLEKFISELPYVYTAEQAKRDSPAEGDFIPEKFEQAINKIKDTARQGGTITVFHSEEGYNKTTVMHLEASGYKVKEQKTDQLYWFVSWK